MQIWKLQIVLKNRKGDTINFMDHTNEIKIMSKSEAEELITLIQDGMNKF